MRRTSAPTMHLAALSAGGEAARGRFNGAVHSAGCDGVLGTLLGLLLGLAAWSAQPVSGQDLELPANG